MMKNNDRSSFEGLGERVDVWCRSFLSSLLPEIFLVI